MIRVLLGALAAGAISWLAHRQGTLSASGQWAAFFLGVFSSAAGWAWATLLVAYFAAATALTRWREDDKHRRTERTVPRATERTATQVLANGGIFVFLAVVFHWSGSARWALGALGALAAASADTWSTEVGTLFGGTPRSLWTARAVPVGMSGGVTFVGSLAGLAGAVYVATVGTAMLSFPFARVAAIVSAAGFAGCLGDSVLGGVLQTKRYCEQCKEWTERRAHVCGYRTKHRAGISWVSNDMVNLFASGTGAAAAMLIGRWFER